MMTPGQSRITPLEVNSENFRRMGYQLVDRIADYLSSLPDLPLTKGESPKTIRQVLGSNHFPDQGSDPGILLKEAADLIFQHSLFNGHRQFYGYITSSAAPIGALGDLLAASANPNVGSFTLGPIATEIEAETIRWIAEMIGYPVDCGGILVSGGNMANFVCFLAARKAKATWDIRAEGLSSGRTLRVYASTETHTWIQKAADLFGLGTNAIRWIPTDEQFRMNSDLLRKEIKHDKDNGDAPFIVIGTAGSVGTGAVDPLRDLSSICKEHNLWFHVDGAYGGFAAVLPDASDDLKALSVADSIAVDPHKWLYAPLEVGCALVRNQQALIDTFSYHPAYYRFHDSEDETPLNYFERGPQNSRGFRALKVWLGLRHAGRDGYIQMISDDVALAKELFKVASEHPELETFTQALSISTFRYVPNDLKNSGEEAESYLNELNTELLTKLQKSGEAFLSNAVIRGAFVLRACIVNFRTSLDDVRVLPEIIVRIGKEVDSVLRPLKFKSRKEH